uniref:tRNA pseudouridine synthase A n=1 Tax=Candidatus Aschnera chinzeii TaxID=1485666 RepID=A0AAT9G520_9ENTR|nr:MAG: tRNA pseudouridine(38-40) synthase TruA [Candidatus Aschnera chinzeii]
MKKLNFKIALGIAYNGTHYYGWERQKNLNTIQSSIEFALTKITNENIKVFCAGRTDTGVHATGQVIHFETSVIRKDTAWIYGINRYLPNDIVVQWYKFVPEDFHSRYSAIARQYYYIIFNHNCRTGVLDKLVTHIYWPLNVNKMNNAAQILVGEHDFSAFRSSKCQSKSSYRKIYHINVTSYAHYVIIDIKANAFLYHMVRNIVTNLIAIGSGKQQPIWLQEVLLSGKKSSTLSPVQSSGLYLVNIEYPIKYKLPDNIIKPFFIL